MRALWLPDALRKWGLDPILVPGWETRGKPLWDVQVVIGHHTGGASTGAYPSLAVVRDGRADLPGPLSQIGLGRDCRPRVIASGKANHAGRGAWAGISDSSRTLGIEAENNGRQPWPDDMVAAYHLTVAALLDGAGLPSTRFCGHREWALPKGRKPDPHTLDLDDFRSAVARLLTHGGDDMFSDQDRDRLERMAAIVDRLDDNANLRVTGLKNDLIASMRAESESVVAAVKQIRDSVMAALRKQAWWDKSRDNG